jgi:hypothetical protein
MGAAIAAGGCYDGDNLGFTPCTRSEECDAPPRATTRRVCLYAEGDANKAGYCALPCSGEPSCGGEAPGDAEATCLSVDAEHSLCVMPCSPATPCPDGMTCRSYASSSGGDCSGETCVCFPDDGAG